MTPYMILMVLMFLPSSVFAAPKFDDVFYTSGPYKGSEKMDWEQMTEEQKAFDLEYYKESIDYCLNNRKKKGGELASAKQCCTSGANSPVSYYMIALKYRDYGDQVKAAEYYYKDWLDSLGNPNWQPFSGEEDEIDVVIFGYERAGMYKEALPFYEKAYEKLMWRLKAGTDIKLMRTNFAEYKKNWPEQAGDYIQFMRDWEKAKKLAKTSKPKPLDPAVQNNEWFHSDKQEEVLKALEYYYNNNVRFMLEKALKHKDPVIAAKAKEYLEKLGPDKENGGDRGR